MIADEGHELIEWDIRMRGAPPSSDVDAVIVLGGDQNVGEELEHPWLHEEYDALRRWVEDGTPLLAICLGAQTLAHALGGTVRPVGETLAGFYVSELTAAGEDDPVLGVLPQRFESFNANGYWFEIPPGAVELATGPVPQAYRVNGHRLGRAVPSGDPPRPGAALVRGRRDGEAAARRARRRAGREAPVLAGARPRALPRVSRGRARVSDFPIVLSNGPRRTGSRRSPTRA